MTTSVRAILSRCRMFARVNEAGMARLVDMAQCRTYDRGAVIFNQGDEAPGTYIVGSGMVRIYKLAPNGKEHVLHLAGPGHTFAEVAVLGRFPCPAHAQALETSHVALLPAGPFLKALAADPQLPMQLLTGMAMWVHHMVDAMENLVLRDATSRLCRYLLDAQDAGVVRLPKLKRHLASKLNLTSETLSRVLRRLQDEELIAHGPGKGDIQLLNAATLQDMADGLGSATEDE